MFESGVDVRKAMLSSNKYQINNIMVKKEQG
jgi:hypothetical protein